jgi:hypothetical protein
VAAHRLPVWGQLAPEVATGLGAGLGARVAAGLVVWTTGLLTGRGAAVVRRTLVTVVVRTRRGATAGVRRGAAVARGCGGTVAWGWAG